MKLKAWPGNSRGYLLARVSEIFDLCMYHAYSSVFSFQWVDFSFVDATHSWGLFFVKHISWVRFSSWLRLASQGMWLATREQLRRLSKRKSCGYLSFDESSVKGHVETHSGSIQMFRPNCGLQKVGGCVYCCTEAEDFRIPHLCPLFALEGVKAVNLMRAPGTLSSERVETPQFVVVDVCLGTRVMRVCVRFRNNRQG